MDVSFFPIARVDPLWVILIVGMLEIWWLFTTTSSIAL